MTCDKCENNIWPENPYLGDEVNAYARAYCSNCGREYEFHYTLNKKELA